MGDLYKYAICNIQSTESIHMNNYTNQLVQIFAHGKTATICSQTNCANNCSIKIQGILKRWLCYERSPFLPLGIVDLDVECSWPLVLSQPSSFCRLNRLQKGYYVQFSIQHHKTIWWVWRSLSWYTWLLTPAIWSHIISASAAYTTYHNKYYVETMHRWKISLKSSLLRQQKQGFRTAHH